MNIGAAVRQIRKSKGVSQVELAEKIGVSQAMLCQIERGTKSLSLPLGVDIAKALGCTIDDIINDTSKIKTA